MKSVEEIVKSFKVETFFTLDYDDLDNLINAYFETDSEYESVCKNEWSNAESHDFTVTDELTDAQKEFQEKWGMSDKKAEEIRLTKKYKNVGTADILDYLCRKGVIKPGKYLVEVYW